MVDRELTEAERQLIVEVLSGEAPPERHVELDTWRGAHPENDRLFQGHARLWTIMGDLAVEGDIAGKHATTQGPSRSWSPLPFGIMVAATTAFLVLLGDSFLERGGEDRVAARRISTGPGEMATLTLSDGGVVHVGAGTTIEFDRSAQGANVFLDGTAFFAVPTRQEEPFRVESAAGTVSVLGTRFNLEATGETLRVAVIEGSVQIGLEDETVQVGANQIGEAEVGGSVVVTMAEDVFDTIQWIDDFTAFQSTPLRDVASEFAERFGYQVEIDDRFAQHTVTAWFQNRAPSAMLSDICLAVNAECSIGDNQARVGSPEP